MNKIGFSLEDFKNIQELIRFTDQKAGAILVAYGFILTIFIECSKNLTILNPLKLTGFITIFCSIGTFISGLILIANMAYQMYFIITQILKPRLCSNYLTDKLSLFYFDHISKMTNEEFQERFRNLTEGEILDEVL